MPSVVTRVSVMVPSCTVRQDGSPPGLHLVRMARRIALDRLCYFLCHGLRELRRNRARGGPGLAGHARPGPAATAAVDEQSVHRIGHVVQGCPHRRQLPERFPLLIFIEEDFEDNAVLMLVPLPVRRAVGDRRLGKGVLKGLFPPPGRLCLGVEYLDRPPLGHVPAFPAPLLCDSTSRLGPRVGSFAVGRTRGARTPSPWGSRPPACAPQPVKYMYSASM